MGEFKLFIEKQDIGQKSFSSEEAKKIGDQIGIDWEKFDLEQFRMGLEVEKEHDTNDPKTDVAHSKIDIGKIALAHLKELPDYYTRLNRMEKGH
jgi:hypothetical protein